MRWMKRAKVIGGVLVLAALSAVTGARLLAVDPSVAAFSIELGGGTPLLVKGYQLEPVERNNKVLYSLKITRGLTNDTSLVNAFQNGVVFNPAVVRVYDNTLTVLTTYTLANASVVSVRHTGATSDGFVTEEIALLATSLSVTVP